MMVIGLSGYSAACYPAGRYQKDHRKNEETNDVVTAFSEIHTFLLL